MQKVTDVRSFTEARHTVGATVEGADLVTVERRQFRPERITVTYDWRTQLNDTDWSARLVEMSGRWVAADGETPTGEALGMSFCHREQTRMGASLRHGEYPKDGAGRAVTCRNPFGGRVDWH